MELKIEYIDIEDLKPYLNNAKIHTAEQIEQIKKSIEEFGMNDPIAVWKENEIIEGHGRLIALKELGYNQAPIVRLDHLNDEQRKAYALVHNKLTMNTDFELELLNDELNEIFDIDMSFFGFNGLDTSIDSFFSDEEIEVPQPKEEEMVITQFNVICKTEKQSKVLKTFLKKQEIEFVENVG